MSQKIKDSILKLKTWHELDLGTHISLKNRYVFFQVSKAASSSIKYHLQKLEIKGTGRKIIDVNNRYVSPHVWPTQLNEVDLLQIFRDPKYKKIAFVRNPFTRILSCYMHRIIGSPQSASNRVLRGCNNGIGGPDISFPEFVKVICRQESKEQESHWRVQSDEILYDLVDEWTFIGRVESLDRDLGIMLQKIVVSNDEYTIGDTKANLSPMVTGAQGKLAKFYDDNTRRLVVDRYREDFERFGYSTRIDQ